jgi:VWFA-related protein
MRCAILSSTLILSLVAQTAWGIDVFVRSPRHGEAVFGKIEVSVEVLSNEAIAAVEIHLDGVLAATLLSEPYTIVIDVGEVNVQHLIEVVARDVSGATAHGAVSTGTIPIDDEIDLELQQLYITATRGDERVLDLTEAHFTVLDNGIEQRRVTFERGDVPLTAVLLLDSSLSMQGSAFTSALAGARAFVQGMGPLDEAKVLVFSDRLLKATPFTGDPDVVTRGMDAVRPAGSTAINDHLYVALHELDARQGRRVIILLSDGIDVDSVLDMREIAWKAGRVQSVIYWIRPGSGAVLDRRRASVWRNAENQWQQTAALEETVISSGGRVHVLDRMEGAVAAFEEILQELRDQYVIGYYPSINRNDGSWHDVDVRVDAPGVSLRFRGGYFDDEYRSGDSGHPQLSAPMRDAPPGSEGSGSRSE